MHISRLLAIAPLLVAACSKPEEERPLVGEHRSPIPVHVYFSAEECVRAGRLDPQRCTSGLRQAMAKHDGFSPRWNGPELCERQHGEGVCTPARPSRTGQPYWRPRPVAFLVRLSTGSNSAPTLFAPVYTHTIMGLYTGQDGGAIEPIRRRGQYQVVGPLNFHLPVI